MPKTQRVAYLANGAFEHRHAYVWQYCATTQVVSTLTTASLQTNMER
mgnify:CR=1 FL=1